MRSPRRTFELSCRTGAFALLGWLLGTSIVPSSERRVERVSQAELAPRLTAWTRSPASVALHGDFTATPPAWAVDWLAALRHSGHVVTWSGTPPAMAMTAEAVADPRGSVRIDVGAPAGERVALRDDASAIDSVHVSNFGGSVTAPMVSGDVIASAGPQTLTTVAPESASIRSIVVIGGASWEGKFVVAALEERGWPVIARFAVAPNVDVAAGAGAPALDTARVAAVVAIDTAVQRFGPAIERYVRAGGGLVLAGPSAKAQVAASLAPGAVGTRWRPAVLPRDTLDLGSTGFFPVSELKRDAVALERRTGGVAVAARRVGAGRVIQVGYDDSWRWRMAGGAGSESAHRDWWSRLIGAVAYAPEARVPSTMTSTSAPLAMLVDRIGAARASPPAGSTRRPIDRRIIFAIIMMLLLAEWGSRRLRGLK